MKKSKKVEEHGYVQMSIFDFMDEDGFTEVLPEIPSKPLFYEKGQKWKSDTVSIELAFTDYGKPFLIFETKGIKAVINCISHFDPWKDIYEPISDKTEVAFAALAFSFYEGETSLNGTKDGHNIHWLSDARFTNQVKEAYGCLREGDHRFTVDYDLRDLYVDKWLGLEKLPVKYFCRIWKKPSESKWCFKRYYNIQVPLGEMLRHMKARPTA